MPSHPSQPRPRWPRPDPHASHLTLAAVAGIVAAGLVGVTGRFDHLSTAGETMIAAAAGLLTMLALAPWRRISGGLRRRGAIRNLIRTVREYDGDHALEGAPDREPLGALDTNRPDDIGELSRAIHRALSNAAAHRIEVHRLRRTMDESIRRETSRVTGRLQRQVLTDPLTGLGNRRALRDHIVSVVQEANMHGRPLAALWIDIDHFKEVNDQLGHAAGDACLVFLGRLLRTSLRERDCAFRNGGDEFVVLMPGAATDVGIKVAERLRSLYGRLTWRHTTHKRPTLSIGVAAAGPGELDDPRELIRRADEAMYAAKRAGRARVVSWRELKDAA
jgi:diguanylate cyclase (GGDEF)-like protein